MRVDEAVCAPGPQDSQRGGCSVFLKTVSEAAGPASMTNPEVLYIYIYIL